MAVFGTRPEAIKMAPLILALQALPHEFEIQICITAQHRQMLDRVLDVFELIPDYDLNVMKKGQDLFDVTSAVLIGMRDILKANKPEVLLVHGDTTTSLAAAMAGFYQGVPVGHIEAGLRTYDINAPFPEEFNRQVVSKIARWHFAPTQLSRENLLAEHVPEAQVTVTGNTVIDVMRDVTERPEAIDAGTVRLVGANRERIVSNITELLDNPESYKKMARAHNPYGDGMACERIINVLRSI